MLPKISTIKAVIAYFGFLLIKFLAKFKNKFATRRIQFRLYNKTTTNHNKFSSFNNDQSNIVIILVLTIFPMTFFLLLVQTKERFQGRWNLPPPPTSPVLDARWPAERFQGRRNLPPPPNHSQASLSLQTSSDRLIWQPS